MATLDDEMPSSPLTRFQRSVPLRQSKITSGPFRATQIWNEVIEHLKEKVELKRRRYKLRNFDDCFTGTDAVDVVLHYLLSDQDTFCSLSREKAVKLCQTLMDKKVFHPVGSKTNVTSRHQFEDSSGKLYHFTGEHNNNKENEMVSESEDETEGRQEGYDSVIEGDDSMVHTSHEHMRISPDAESAMLGRPGVSASSPLTTTPLHKRINSEIFESRKRKNGVLDTSQRQQSKRQKMCSSSTESLNEEELSDHQIQEIWKEVALCQLLTKVDLSFLDGVLTDDKEKSTKKTFKPCHPSGLVSNIVAKHWSMKCSAGSARHVDIFMKSALEVIAGIPRGISKFDTDFTQKSDPVTKLQAYNMICEHYSGKLDPLFPDRFLDLNAAIMQLITSGRVTAALQAMQLNMMLLPLRRKIELQKLLKFMSAAAHDQELQLDPQLASDNERMVLVHLTDSVLKHKGLTWNLSSAVVQFLVQNAEQVFQIPDGLAEKVDARIREVKTGVIPVVEETVFCSQVPASDYQQLTEDSTNSALVQMMNSIIDDPKMNLKEKKQRLQKFRKYHPNIYTKHFVGML